ncbi:MAG: hypothetical protein ACRCU3_02965 [Eubacteriaceae bacterium]
MKKITKKIAIILSVICMLVASGSAVLAATPNEQVVAAVGASQGASSYAGITASFLRDTGKVLTQGEANGIIAEINAASALYVNPLNATAATQIQGHFERAVGIAGFVVTNVARTSSGGFTFTVYDPASGKTVTVQGNKTGGYVDASISGAKTNAVPGTTQVAKTSVDNSMFLLAGILGIATVVAGAIVYKRRITL